MFTDTFDTSIEDHNLVSATSALAYAFLNHIGVISVVTATIMITVVYMFDDKTPDVTPIPATIRPTSPLDIIPIPTIIAFDLFLKNNREGNPHPSNLLTIATDNYYCR